MNKVMARLRALPKTLRFNFHYFPWRHAIRLPVSVSHTVRLERLNGRVLINDHARRGRIKLGFAIGDTFIHQNPPMVWKVDGDVRFGGSARLGEGCYIEVHRDAVLEFGGECVATARSAFFVRRRVSFGKACLISWDVTVMDTDFHPVCDAATGQRLNDDREVEVGDHVWIGAGATLLKGTAVAAGCVIGTKSLLAGRFEESAVVLAGQPALVVKREIVWAK